jgi:hypothetical protein
MSAIASLYNVPQSDESLKQWAFVHMAHHRDIIRTIYELLKVALPEYQLDPIDPKDTGVWDYQHQVMHQQMDAVLGIAGNDLTGVQWTNPNELAGWIFLNSSEHQQAANILEIG